MSVQPGVWGIDLGQCGLKAIRLQEIDGQLVATAFDYVEHPKILSQPDADPDQLTREALDKFLSRNNLRGDIVAISVPGQSGLARFVKLPPVEEKKIADIVRFEAKQQIPFNLEEVVWDYQKIGSGVVTDGFAMETEIGLFAMKRDMVNRYLQHFKDVGVEVHLVQMAPLALCNYVAYDLLGKEAVGGGEGGDKNCVVALDIGTDSSNLVITDGERIIWQRPIPLGGNHFTRALTKDLKLTFAKAEHLKRNATKSPDLKKILAALKPVLNDFVGEVQRSLGYFTNTHREAHISYMIGLGNAFRLPGLQKFLSEKLQLEVRKLGKMERLTGDQVVTQQVYTENILTFAVAYGLALQGIKRARLLTNLLPAEIRVERLVRAKKPFAVAAAAALLLAAGGLALSYALEYRTYGDSRVKKAIEAADAASKRAEDADRKFKAAKKNAEDEEAAVRTIVAGQFERDNWLQLLKFVSSTIPQPNGDQVLAFQPPSDPADPILPVTIPDIPPSTASKYWNAKGKEAYKEYMRRQLTGPSTKEPAKEGGPANGAEDLGRGIEDLIQFNIESVNSFYCDNLKNYWDGVLRGPRVSKIGGQNLVVPATDFAKAPEGTGWIVEIQGFTYHKDAETFIRNTLLENIARMGIPSYREGPAAPAAPASGASAAPNTPAPATLPAPVPGQAPAGQAEEGPDLGPVIGHVSHVVLHNYETSTGKGAPTSLSQNTARELALAGAAPSGGGGMMGGMMDQMRMMRGGPSGGGGMGGMTGGQGGEQTTPTGPSRDAWTPLNARGGGPTSGAGVAGGVGMMGMRMMQQSRGGGGVGMMGSNKMPPMMAPGRGGIVPPTTGGMTTPQPPGGADADNGPKRTEFVILFLWREPTPSDDLRGQTTAASASGTTTATSTGNSAPTKFRARRFRGDRNKDKDQSKDISKEKDKSKENDIGKDKDKDKSKENDINKDKDKSKDKDGKAG
jgi:type IV pilus assembly protein PilM